MTRKRWGIVFRLSILALTILLLLPSSSIRAQASGSDAWRMYGHDARHSNCSAASGPAAAKIKWTHKTDGEISSVIVGPDGVVYFTLKVFAQADRVVALNPDGSEKWKKDVRTMKYVYLALGANRALYIYGDYGEKSKPYVMAVEAADGKAKWMVHLSGTYNTYGRLTIGKDGTIYVPVALGGKNSAKQSGMIYALNPDGSQKWAWKSKDVNCGIETTPALAQNGTLYVQHNTMCLVALDSKSGKLLWTVGGLGWMWNSPSVGADNTVYIGNSDNSFCAVNPNGKIKWKATVENWMYYTTNAHSPDGALVYRGDNNGVLYAFDTKAGTIRWRFRVNKETWFGHTPVVAANGIIYFTSGGWTTSMSDTAQGYLYALNASTGALLWKYKVGFANQDPAIGPDGTLYVVADQPGLKGDLRWGNCRWLQAFAR